MNKLLLSLSGIFAAIPGILIMQNGLGSPPTYKWLFGGVIESFGALTLLALWANREKIRSWSAQTVTRIVIALIFVAFISIALYLFLFGLCVVQHQTRGTVYYPLWLQGEIAAMVETAGTREAALERYGYGGVVLAINEMPNTALVYAITTTLLLFIYQTIFTSVTASFGILGIQSGASIVESANNS
jgi:hypothetical protein